MNHTFADLLIEDGVAIVDNIDRTFHSGLTLAPEFFIGSVEVDYDVIVDPDIAHENVSQAVLEMMLNYKRIDHAVNTDYIFGVLKDGKLSLFYGRESSPKIAAADAIAWDMGVFINEGKPHYVPSPQRVGTAYQRRSYAESVAEKII